jgi:hypothetical protein
LAEKSHQQFINGVEAFDKKSMKHTETEEKNPLPDQTGKPSELTMKLHVHEKCSDF